MVKPVSDGFYTGTYERKPSSAARKSFLYFPKGRYSFGNPRDKGKRKGKAISIRRPTGIRIKDEFRNLVQGASNKVNKLGTSFIRTEGSCKVAGGGY